MGNRLLGAGLNNVRGSSFVLSLLGQVGVVGFGLFVAFLVSLVRTEANNQGLEINSGDSITYRRFATIFLLCVLLGMCLSEPDLFLSTFWLAVMHMVLMG